MAEEKVEATEEEVKPSDFKSRNEQAEDAKLDAEHKMYDLNVTAEERGYEVDGPKLAPENELREDPRDPDSPKSVDSDEDDDSEDEDAS